MNVPARWNINDIKGEANEKRIVVERLKEKIFRKDFLICLFSQNYRTEFNEYAIITSVYWIFDDVCIRTSNRALINKGLVPRGIRPVCCQTSMGNHVNFDRIRFSVTWSGVSRSVQHERSYNYNRRATNQSKNR